MHQIGHIQRTGKFGTHQIGYFQKRKQTQITTKKVKILITSTQKAIPTTKNRIFIQKSDPPRNIWGQIINQRPPEDQQNQHQQVDYQQILQTIENKDELHIPRIKISR